MSTGILRAVEALSDPGDVIELRALKNGTTAAGYFDNAADLAREAAKLDEQGFTVYVTANPVLPALMARAENRVKRPLKATTSDKDVLRRRWLLVDFDPERPSDVSSTDAEKEAALQRAREVYGYLKEQGWPEPVAGDSGNGAHLVYAMDLPNDAESLELVKGVLEAASFKFSDGQVKVDTTTSNAARIWKLYGTTARKGDSTKDRPHRVSKLLKVPEQRIEVSREQLQAVAASKPETPKPERRVKLGEFPEFDLEAWISDHSVPVKRVPGTATRTTPATSCASPAGASSPAASTTPVGPGRTAGASCASTTSLAATSGRILQWAGNPQAPGQTVRSP